MIVSQSKAIIKMEKQCPVAKFNEIPPRVEYSLTDSGKELIKCFKNLNNWAKKYG